MVKQGTYVTPSLYFSWKTMEFMRKRMSAQWLAQEERWLEQGYRAVEKANKAGVKLVIGDDFGTSWMPHFGTYAVELDFYVKFAGTSPLDVIRWATRNGAGLLGLGDQIGTIEAGKIADLLVVNGVPGTRYGSASRPCQVGRGDEGRSVHRIAPSAGRGLGKGGLSAPSAR